MVAWTPIIIAVVVTLFAAWLSKRLPPIVMDIAGFLAGLFLLGIWLAALGVPEPAQWVDKIPYLNWIVGAVAGVLYGKLLWRWMPF